MTWVRLGPSAWKDRFVGTDPSGRWERITLLHEADGSGISLFAVDRSNSNGLYASLVFPLDTSQNPTRIKTAAPHGDGDVRLDRFMSGFGAFRYQTRIGPTPFLGFSGYPQPTLLAFDPSDSKLVIAGGHDSGVFLSRTGGQHWELVTDPFDPVGSGVPHLTQPRYAYFDHDPLDAIHIYIGTVGRGVWRMRIPGD